MTELSPIVVLLGVPAVALGVLTATGSLRRGTSVTVALMSGIFFPVAWVVWYVQDELREGPA